MAVELRPVCICDKCQHVWLPPTWPRLPTECPHCRARTWNGPNAKRPADQTQERRDLISEEW